MKMAQANRQEVVTFELPPVDGNQLLKLMQQVRRSPCFNNNVNVGMFNKNCFKTNNYII